jgi:hypothetical protein
MKTESAFSTNINKQFLKQNTEESVGDTLELISQGLLAYVTGTNARANARVRETINIYEVETNI